MVTQAWTKSLSPYHVTGTITVPAGNTLTIEAGVDVLFNADAQLVVQGSFRALGTSADSIRLTRGTASNWRGIRISGGDTSIIAYTRISGANARGSAPDNSGGALHISGSGTRVGVENSVLSGNRAEEGAAGVFNGATLTMTYCAVSGNSARNAGGIRNEGTLVVANCAIWGNSGSQGGGGIVNHGTARLTMLNCTVANNTAGANGGGIANATNSPGFLTLTNTIVWGNNPAEQVFAKSGTVTMTYSDVQRTSGTQSGLGNINTDPLFMSAASGDFRLRAGSPCVNSGDPASPLETDGTRADMGAFSLLGSVVVAESETSPPFALFQNAPNPFNPSTAIRFSTPDAAAVDLGVFSVDGRLVRTLANRSLSAGQQEIVWDGLDHSGRACASGVYVYRLTAKQGVLTKRMTLVR
jgi:hypothetical protein